VPFRVSVNLNDTVISSIRNQLRGRAQYSWEPLNEAANFCLTHKTNLEDGLKWADLSIQNEERFENLSTKADLLQAMNRTDEAKMNAQKQNIKIWIVPLQSKQDINK